MKEITAEMLQRFGDISGQWTEVGYLASGTGNLWGRTASGELFRLDFLADLPLCLGVLEAVCLKEGWGYTIHFVQARDACKLAGLPHYNVFIECDGSDFDDWPDECGATINEAIIRALSVIPTESY